MIRIPLALALCAATIAPAALRAQSLPTPQRLAERHDSIVGGRAALAAHTSIRFVGSFSLPMMGLEAPLEILKVKPNKYLFRTSLGQMGDVMSGYDGTNAWSVQPGQGAMLLTGAPATQLAEQADFLGDLHDLAKFVTVETVDEADVEGTRVYRVKMVRASGDIVMEYFDVASGLSVGGTTNVETPMGRVEMTSVVGDYKEFGGIRVATRIVQRNPQYEIILTFASVEFDTVDAAAVAPPEAVKALIKPWSTPTFSPSPASFQ